MKNRTLFKQEYIDAAMRASNFDNNKYKIFKMIYNIFGLLFGMGCIRYLIFQIMGSEEADWFMVIFYACAAAVFLYKRKYHNIYSRMVGITFTYDIDAEYIVVTDEEDDKDTFSWDDIIKWNQDTENIYLFVSADDCLVINKEGFVEGTYKDLTELATAVMGLRDDEENINE